MHNIPVFTAACGMASLILQEIPYSGRAYVMLRSVWNGQTEGLLAECAQFCRAAGASEVFASDGEKTLPARHAYDVLELQLPREALPAPRTPVQLEALSRANQGAYLEIYNACFRSVPGAASYGKKDMERLVGKGKAFLAVRDGGYAGVAELGDGTLEGVAVLPAFRGLGYDLTASVLAKLTAPVLRLKVASTNAPALALYRRLGFSGERPVSSWWKLG